MQGSQNAKEFGYYIFIANSVEFEPFTKGEDIAKVLAGRGMWLASRFTPFRRLYKAGDHVLLYVAGRGARYFIGDAEIGGHIEDANAEDIATAEALGLDGFREKIPLSKAAIWKESVPIKPLVEKLSFIKDKRNYGLHLRQAATRINREDYDRLMQHADPAATQEAS